MSVGFYSLISEPPARPGESVVNCERQPSPSVPQGYFQVFAATGNET